jgi:hypothetical protein
VSFIDSKQSNFVLLVEAFQQRSKIVVTTEEFRRDIEKFRVDERELGEKREQERRSFDNRGRGGGGGGRRRR